MLGHARAENNLHIFFFNSFRRDGLAIMTLQWQQALLILWSWFLANTDDFSIHLGNVQDKHRPYCSTENYRIARKKVGGKEGRKGEEKEKKTTVE